MKQKKKKPKWFSQENLSQPSPFTEEGCWKHAGPPSPPEVVLLGVRVRRCVLERA